MYTITSGTDVAVTDQHKETATEALEFIRDLNENNIPILAIKDRDGAIVTIAQLEKLSDKENI